MSVSCVWMRRLECHVSACVCMRACGQDVQCSLPLQAVARYPTA